MLDGYAGDALPRVGEQGHAHRQHMPCPEAIMMGRMRAAMSLSRRYPSLPLHSLPKPPTELFNSLGVKVSKEKVKEMFAEVDEDGSGEIDFEEFLVLVAKQVYLKPLPMRFSHSKLLRTARLHDFAVSEHFGSTTGEKRVSFSVCNAGGGLLGRRCV